MICIGIDPGITGAVAAVANCALEPTAYDMPTMRRSLGKAKVKNQVDPMALKELILRMVAPYHRNETIVVMERVSAMPGQGVAGVFSLGHTSGMIEAVIITMGLRLELVSPATWKRRANVAKDKNSARSQAQLRFPGVDLHLVKHHNKAEALLLADYGLKTYA
jgi:crossover junction endodeoxyribonuclease RuvC